MRNIEKRLIVGLIGIQLLGWSASSAAEGIVDDFNGRYKVSSYTINNNACGAEGEHYLGYENTTVKILADKNLTVPSGRALSLFNCADANDTTCSNYWSEWFFDTKNPEGSWTSDFSRFISKGLDPNTCSMLLTVKKISRSGHDIILESRSYSTPAFQYVPVSPDQAECTNMDLVEQHKSKLTECSLYTRAVLTSL